MAIDLGSILGWQSRWFSEAMSPGSLGLVAKLEDQVEEGQATDMEAFDVWVVQDKGPRNQQRSGTATHEA